MTLTDEELLRMFNKPVDATRWLPSTDSDEYLKVVTYLVQRNRDEGAG